MAATLTIAVIAVLIISAIFQWTGKRALSGWMLVLFPFMLCGAALINLSHGVEGIGRAAYESTQRQFFFGVVLLGLSLLAAFAPRWRWVYWAAWACNLLAVGVLTYLVFLWRPFS